MKLSIIIPAYNEEQRIGMMLDDYCRYFAKMPKGSVEILVVLNGCRDHTLDVVKHFTKKYHFLHYADIPRAIGKGGAVIEGFKRARGDLVGYADADGATAAVHFHKLVGSLHRADGAIASRWMPGAVVQPRQPFQRRFASRAFNLLIKLLFRLSYYDTQCGCKLFKREVVAAVLPALGTTRWAFDVDLLYQLKRRQFTIREVPTTWKDKTGSSIRVLRVSAEMFLALVRLRLVYSPFRFVVGAYNKVAGSLGIRF